MARLYASSMAAQKPLSLNVGVDNPLMSVLPSNFKQFSISQFASYSLICLRYHSLDKILETVDREGPVGLHCRSMSKRPSVCASSKVLQVL